MITLNGIVLQFANQTISKYTESDDLLAYAYGNLGNLDWSAINPAVASIEVTDGNFDEDLNMTISTGVVTGVNTGTTEITVSNSQYSVSFYTTVEETTAPDIHPEAEVNSVNPLYFSTLIDDFKFSSNEIFEDETLISLSSLSVPPAMGTLYYGYQNPDNMGAGVATERSYYITGEPNVKDIVFVPNTSYTGSEISISYTGTTDSNRLFSGKIILSLSAIEDVEITTAAETPVNLVATQFAQVSTSKIGQTLSHITLHLPAETRGTFYYQYVNEENYHHKIALGEEIAAANISNVTFIPAAGYTGALPVSYTGVTVSNLTYSGTMTIHVGAYGADGPVVYNTRVNEYVTFTTTSFESNVEALTGNRLSHVVFTPPSASEGVLYEDYISSYNYLRQVNETITYYSTSRSPYISSISFVPATDFTGTCSIPFVGYDIEGNSYQGTVQINVANFVEGDINYYATSGGYVRFNDDDFNSLSTTLAESNIDYIYFDSLPSTSTGTIRYGQTSSSSGSLASTGTHYYRNSSSYIDDLTFEANAWFTGVAEIPFHGVGTNGKTFSGIVSVVVTNQSVARISYTATFNQPAQLSLEDFNHISMERTGTSLDYVRFALPYSSQASLYYNYTNANQNEGLVTAGRSYYATSSPLVDNISIVPYPSYSGVCEISFVGWGTNGKEFYGTISVTIGTASQPLGYEVHHGDYITLDSSDINAYVLSEINSPLDYITISLPTTSQGTLYQTYTETATYNPKASASTKYYRSSTPYINNLTFVPNPDFYGTVSLDFTAKTTDGSTSKGTIYIEVLPMQAEGTIYYSTTINAIEFDTEDFDAVWSGDDIAYVVFDNIPVTTQGKLYYANSLSALAAAGERYYMDPALTPNFGEMIFAPMAGYYDPIRLSYTATTSNGGRFVGEIQINIERTTVSSSFNDMSEYTWAIAAAEYLKLADVTSGVAIGSYGPSSRITRGDYALMLVKAFHLSTTTPTTAFNDVDSSKYYAAAIYTLRALGIVTGNNNSYSPDSYISRQDAMLMLYQAMTVAGKNLPIGSTAYLIPYNDDQDISDYAVNALGTMVRATLITGDNNNNLNPQNNMSRAEMAVVLHKAMTI
ncbi:MAG: S-layer homology domain-containing protein [Eubacteriales bacterium]